MGTHCFAPVWGAGQSLTSGAFRCCLASFWAEGLWWGSGDGPRGVSQMLPDGDLLKNRVGTFTPSHSLASLAGTGARTPCPHHLLPLPSRLQSGWELGRLATGAEEAIWRAQSPHTLVSYSVSSPPPIAHPSLWLALRSSTHTRCLRYPPDNIQVASITAGVRGRHASSPLPWASPSPHGTPGPLSPATPTLNSFPPSAFPSTHPGNVNTP